MSLILKIACLALLMNTLHGALDGQAPEVIRLTEAFMQARTGK